MLSCHNLSGALLLAAVLSFSETKGQNVFWTEDFGSGCNQALLASAYTGANGTWTVTFIGGQGSKGNKWFVSSTEADMGQANCGDGCLNTVTLTNRTLHLGSVAVGLCGAPGDCGAAYNAGGTGLTNARAESPLINCTGLNTITLSYNYMLFGDGTNDNGTVYYSSNGGGTWSLLDSPPKTLCCDLLGGPPGTCDGLFYGQGLWVQRSVALPAACNNNASVKIAFLWINNADNVGTDPSFAVDSLILTSPVVLPVELTSFNATAVENKVELTWKTNSETNNNYFTVERTEDGTEFSEVGIQSGSGTTSLAHTYQMADTLAPKGTSYYRLKQTDFNGNNHYSALRPVVVNGYAEALHVSNPENSGNGEFAFWVSCAPHSNLVAQITDVNGRLCWSEKIMGSDRLTHVSGIISGHKQGIYFLKVSDGITQAIRKLLL